MAMLAEPRRKQKWTLNPRGKQWSEDSNKFGQKMLEKMGWTAGKGLGVNEQGITEHVRVQLKNDTSGIGFSKDKDNEAWTEHQEGFNEILQQLQQNQDVIVINKKEDVNNGISSKSLELKSKQSRARVHYQKFTRGKDVNRYSLKDMANIFGQKDLNIKTENKKEEEEKKEENNIVSKNVDTQETDNGIVTIHGGSITDYFKNKMSNIKSSQTEKKVVRHSKDKSKKSNDCENSEEVTNENNCAYENPCLDDDTPVDSAKSKTKKIKKRKKEMAYENGGLDLECTDDSVTANSIHSFDSKQAYKNGFVNCALEINYSSEQNESYDNGSDYEVSRAGLGFRNNALDIGDESFSKKRLTVSSTGYNGFVNSALDINSPNTHSQTHNGADYEVSRAEFGLTNSALDITDEVSAKKRVTFNDHVEYSTDSTKNKKVTATLDKFEVENQKRRKKRKRDCLEETTTSVGFVNEALDLGVSEEVQDNEVNERKSKKCKRRKEYRLSHLETIQEVAEEDKEVIKEEITETIAVEKTEDLRETITERTDSEGTRKKNKKRKLEASIAPNVKSENEGIEVEETVARTRSERELVNDEISKIDTNKEKKKKKKSKKEKSSDDSTTIETDDINDNSMKCEESLNEDENFDVEIEKCEKKEKRKLNKSTAKEKEISDKEDTNDEGQDVTPNKKKKHDKEKRSKRKISEENPASMDISINKENDSLKLKSEEGQTIESPRVNPRKDEPELIINQFSLGRRQRMSKKMLKMLFLRNATRSFPGGNVHLVSGYGTSIYRDNRAGY